MAMFPLMLSIDKFEAMLDILLVARSLAFAVESLAVMLIAPFVVEMVLLMLMLRPALTVKLAPDVVIASASTKMTSELACKVTLAAAATMLAGVITLAAPMLFANKLFVPAL